MAELPPRRIASPVFAEKGPGTEVLARAGSKRYAIQPPGRAMGLVAARKALQIWTEVAITDGARTEVSIIDTPHAQKEMAEILSGQSLG